MLKGKKILLGITGSIAAYKSAILIRELKKVGAEVQVILTDAAATFITPLTLATLSEKPVLMHFADAESGVWNSHVDLGLWADVFLIAPATANTIAKMTSGECDHLLLATYLSAKCPVFIAPAMDMDMYQHPTFIQNIQQLQSYGNHIIESTFGALASGLIGQGRMAEPEDIVVYLQQFWADAQSLKGFTALVSAGPTQEAIDPVRYISNHSTGKMGYALAEALAKRGASVILVAGPTQRHIYDNRIQVIDVLSAEEMFVAMSTHFSSASVVIFAAAVADYTPLKKEVDKIKKNEDTLTLALVKTKDIAYELGLKKQAHQVLVGFALETNNEEANAKAKMSRKNLDFMVLNSLNDLGAGFGHDTNKVTIFSKNNTSTTFPLASKKTLATDIIQYVISNTDKL
jgi:phosphopantothenoylcysteine decarboxylase/phosphopantothenate--cysteine ligase